MAKYSKEQRRTHIALARRIVVNIEAANEYPSIDRVLAGLVAAHEKNKELPRISSTAYVSFLRDKVLQQRHTRVDKQAVGREIAKVEDEFDENVAYLSSILRNPLTPPIARVAAARAIGEMRQRLIDMKFDAGVFTRNLGTLETETLADRLIKQTLGYDRGKVITVVPSAGQLPAGRTRADAVPVPDGDQQPDTDPGAIPPAEGTTTP